MAAEVFTLASTLASASYTFIAVPGSTKTMNDADDRGGGEMPHIRAGNRAKVEIQCLLDATGGSDFLLANAMVVLTDMNNDWTLTGSVLGLLATGVATINLDGDAGQVATITVG